MERVQRLEVAESRRVLAKQIPDRSACDGWSASDETFEMG